MTTRRLPLILPLLALPALIGCSGGSKSDAAAPLSEAAVAAVSAKADVPRRPLARAIDGLFADEAAGETRALLVLHNGQIVAERYGNGYSSSTRFLGWSMAKSVTAVMIGLLVSDGRLRLDDPAPVPQWQRPGDARGKITVRQLLQMRSGLRHTEGGRPRYAADDVRLMFRDGRDDMAAHAEDRPFEAEPGSKNNYSSATAIILADIAARVLTPSDNPDVRRTAVSDFLHKRLLAPLEMRSAVPEFDPAGTLIGSNMISATARDWGRFGEFLRNEGAVRGAQIVPRAWIQFMTTPSPPNPAYGGQLWLNRRAPDGRDVLFVGRAPPSLFSCIGHFGQYVVVSPAQGLTLVRLGRTEDEDTGVVRDHLAQILKMYPAQ